jgi:asparagine synthase (glutamine-hydrolysing)
MDSTIETENYEKNIVKYLCDAVKKRCLNTERPIACLLSGGLDSSLITALVNHFYKMEYGLDKTIETYSIGLKNSEDLKYAKIVAEYLGTNHTEIILTEKEMFEAIPEVIYALESYDTTTIRASIGNYLLGKYISKNSEAKVIFNGDGSDELSGGYLYMKNCPDSIEFDSETRRLLKDIHLFDVLRSDKSISSHGLEPRTPFLDKTFVNYYLSIPQKERFEKNKIIEKYFIRNSFTYANFEDVYGKQLLPDEILWRKKEAFSDGVTSKGRSLYVILQEFISTMMKLENYYEDNIIDKYPPNIETEKMYYKKIFDSYYIHCDNIIPYFWMPRYTNATDPSARTLSLYHDNSNDKNLENITIT